MRSVLLTSCVALIICHLADSASIISKSDVAKRAENAKPLGRQLTVQDHKTTNELIALLKAKISGQHIRQAEACPSSEFLEIDTDTFGLFLYPSNNPNQEENESTADDDDDDNHSVEQDNEDEQVEEDGLTDEKRKTSRISTRSRRVVKHGRETEPDDEDDSFMIISSLFDDTEEQESTGEHNEDDGDSEDTEEHVSGAGSGYGKASEDVKASEYKELINLLRSNIHRQATIGRAKRSVRANGYLSARGVNNARTDVQCSHVIETTQKVITVIVLADECDNGEVHLYNGNDASGDPYVVHCGQDEEAVINTDGSVYIEYVYDSSSYHGGFGLLWIGSN